jgi:hypothetical protein
MPVFLRVPLGLAVMVIGFLIVWKTERVFEWFGTNDFAEKKLGPGQSRFFYKLVGTGVAFLGMFIATNVISDIFSSFANIFVPRR